MEDKEQPKSSPIPFLQLASGAMLGILAGGESGETVVPHAWDYAEALVREGVSRGLINIINEEK